MTFRTQAMINENSLFRFVWMHTDLWTLPFSTNL